MIRILGMIAVLCLFDGGARVAKSDESCVPVDKLTEQVKAKERPYTVFADAGAVTGAIAFYNSIDGAQIDRADTVILIDLPNGILYMVVAFDGNACWGLRIGPARAESVRRLIMGRTS